MPSQPIAKDGDRVVGTDVHVVLVPSATGPVPTPMPIPFAGKLADGLSPTTYADGQAVAVEGAEARNDAEHVAVGGSFQTPPRNRGAVREGSPSVFVDGKGVAAHGGVVWTCADPEDAPNGAIVAEGTVFVGEPRRDAAEEGA
ncbi:MAG: hypothetical protein HY908_27260 [Myxococcales bacterium]|nr:hypothetical protein [Myxococcales bacterium]